MRVFLRRSGVNVLARHRKMGAPRIQPLVGDALVISPAL
jgi:hypothetical protein